MSRTSRRVAPAQPTMFGDITAPPSGVSYPLTLTGQGQAFRCITGVALALFSFLFVSAIGQLVALICWVVLGRPGGFVDFWRTGTAFEHPSGMIAAHVGLGCLTVLAWTLVVWWNRRPGHFLVSVQPGMRWRYLLATLLLAAVVLNAVMLLSGPFASMEVNPQPQFWAFLIVIVLTSPLQAMGEEFFFRGYLLQALGSAFGNKWVGVVASALVFAVFHGVQNAPLFVDRLVFGLLAALLVLYTGGLEAAIAAHVINNVCAFLYAAMFTSVAEARAIRTITWNDAFFDILGFTLFALVAWFFARRMNLATTTP